MSWWQNSKISFKHRQLRLNQMFCWATSIDGSKCSSTCRAKVCSGVFPVQSGALWACLSVSEFWREKTCLSCATCVGTVDIFIFSLLISSSSYSFSSSLGLVLLTADWFLDVKHLPFLAFPPLRPAAARLAQICSYFMPFWRLYLTKNSFFT